jgi:16S rRNA (guanine527-N7)-methyltransferase
VPVALTASTPPDVASAVFAGRLPLAMRYASLLAGSGAERGLIGPREVDRLWDRHLLNCAVIGEVIAGAAQVIDLGSGAGLPGLPLALARPDLDVTLLEPMARRVAWLSEVIEDLGVPVRVVRGRAEEPVVRDELGGADVVTARAVAPLARLAGWALPLLADGGLLVAIKGSTALSEVARDGAVVHALGGRAVRVRDCGDGIVDPLTRVVIVERRGLGVSTRVASVNPANSVASMTRRRRRS